MCANVNAPDSSRGVWMASVPALISTKVSAALGTHSTFTREQQVPHSHALFGCGGKKKAAPLCSVCLAAGAMLNADKQLLDARLRNELQQLR